MMVGRAGQPKGWPVLCSGSLNPVRLTTQRLTIQQNLSHTGRTRTYMRPTAPDSFAAFLCLQYGVNTSEQRPGGEALIQYPQGEYARSFM
ncbi:ash family protein [Serratia marcescens]|nr:ash family protein [Serratia marcescens]